jgi:hypothetical protein
MYNHPFLFVLLFCFPSTSLLCNFRVLLVILPSPMSLFGLRDRYPDVYILTIFTVGLCIR